MLSYTETFVNSNIVGYIHVCQKEGWKRSFDILMDSIKISKLYDNVDEIRIYVVNNESGLIDDDRFNDNKFKVIYLGKSDQYERPTLLHLRNASFTDPENTKYFYLHTKGLRQFNTKNEKVTLDWINNMLDCNIINWKNAVSKLDTFDTFGCNYNDLHYSGNFWWATNSHIRQLPDSIPDDYIAPENWVLLKNDNMFCQNNCGKNYKALYTEDMY